jgi:O-antigen/teichoic acid export membrane protein
MAQVGIGPGLTLGIAASSARGDKESETKYFSSALIMIGTVVLSLGTILVISIWALPLSIFFGDRINIATVPELRIDMVFLVVCLLSRILLSVFDASQAGYQEQYITNLWATLGNSLSLLALLFITRVHPMILTVIIAVNAMPIIADACNGTRLLTHSHPNLRLRFSSFDWKLGKSLLSNGIAFSTVVASSYLMYSCSIVLIGRMHGPKSAAMFAVLQNACNTALGMVVMLAQPLWPALNDAKARQDRVWALSASRRIIIYGMTYAGLFGCAMAFFGHEIFKIWYHGRINITLPIQIFFGLYFVLAVWEYVHYNILIGMNKIYIPAGLMVLRSILMLSIAPFMITKFGNVGLSISLCLAQITLSTWIFPILVNRALSKDSFFKGTERT